MSESQAGSPALQFIQSQGWNFKEGQPNYELENCPYCPSNKTKYGHFYIRIHGPEDKDAKWDGVHNCHRCGKSGTLYTLKQHLGVSIPSVSSQKDWAAGAKRVDKLPDVDACHEALLSDIDAMDYLMNERGFSRDIIQRQKIGLKEKQYFRECGEVRALVYPYLVNGNCVFAHYRTLPTLPLSENRVPKAFASPTGHEAPLYNGEVLREGITSVLLVEGEANTIAALDHGIETVCGVPGASLKKAEWIVTLDKLGLEKTFICYDSDKAGQKGAQALAARIGTERCWRVLLPEFTVPTEDGGTKAGKDLNEWFIHGGGTSEGLSQLLEEAEQFDVDGVSASRDALDEFEEELIGKGAVSKYRSPWESLNKYVLFDEGDIIDILAPEKIGKTTFGIDLMEHMVDAYGEDGVIICLEMTRAKLARKWISHLAQIPDNIPKTVEEGEQLTQQFLKAIPLVKDKAANRKGELYFCMPKYKTTADIYKLMRDCIRRYGVKWIMIDNIQRLADTTPKEKGSNRTEHLSTISKVTSQIGKEFGVQMVRILQPKRVEKNQVVSTDDVDGASQIAKDCDAMITLHRNRMGVMNKDQLEAIQFVEQDASFDNKMYVTVGLSRYSSGGTVTLDYDGATSTVKEFNTIQVSKLKQEANKDIGYENQLAKLGVVLNKLGAETPEEETITI